jgi:hypothetical protein
VDWTASGEFWMISCAIATAVGMTSDDETTVLTL